MNFEKDFKTIKKEFNLTHKQLSEIFSSQWCPYEGHPSHKATWKRMEATQKLYKLFSESAYQKGVDDAVRAYKLTYADAYKQAKQDLNEKS